jgi:hypothetical protein
MKKCLLCLLIAFLGACAQLPKVKVTYFDPIATTTVTVTQTVSCDAQKLHPVVGTSVAQKTVYQANSASSHEFDLSQLDGAFSDSDTTFEFTEDGRLKGVNASSEGQAKDIVTAALTLAATVWTYVDKRTPPVRKSDPARVCQIIDQRGTGKDEKSLIIESTAHFPAGHELDSEVAWETKLDDATLAELRGLLPELDIHLYALLADDTPVVTGATATRDVVPLTLAKTMTKTFFVYAYESQSPYRQKILWFEDVTVPKRCVAGDAPCQATYDLPVPKAAAFGKEAFALSLSDSGVVTKVRYAKNAGIGGALSATSAALESGRPQTAADKAKQLQGEADLIAQQQRLAKCRATPAECE